MLSYQQVESLDSAFGQQSRPLIEVLESMTKQVKDDLSGELATKSDIAEFREVTKSAISELKVEIAGIKGSINTLREMTKRDFETLEGRIDTLNVELRGQITQLDTELKGLIRTSDTELKGELTSIRLLMKTLIGLVIFGISFFSPVGVKLVEFALKGIK
ncbi:MAG: DUF1640 domain-containing protein [Deltaproteobacteria bacterium]|nr:DUF1640 domain-containing protein [Deltaproteobacteria bacterium]